MYEYFFNLITHTTLFSKLILANTHLLDNMFFENETQSEAIFGEKGVRSHLWGVGRIKAFLKIQ